MQVSYKVLEALVERHQWETCDEYGEPGYHVYHDTSMAEGTHTPKIVLGNYNDQSYHTPKQQVSRHARIMKQLEQQGVMWEWSDEWTIDSDHNKAYRTNPDSHWWQPSYVYTEGGDMLTADDDISEWIVWATDSPAERCIPTRIIKRQQIMDAGFFLIHDRMENGFHQGMDADPAAMYDMEQDNMAKSGNTYRYLFTLDETSQFYMTFSMWAQRVKVLGDYGWDTETYDFRELAGLWHDGQASALYAFSSSGHVSDGLVPELKECIELSDEGNTALLAMLEWVMPQVNQEGE